MADPLQLSVAWGDAAQQTVLALQLPAPCTVREVLDAARATGAALPGGPGVAVGIYGRVVNEAHVVHNGDRIELLQPLQADPKEQRRARVRAARRRRVTGR